MIFTNKLLIITFLVEGTLLIKTMITKFFSKVYKEIVSIYLRLPNMEDTMPIYYRSSVAVFDLRLSN